MKTLLIIIIYCFSLLFIIFNWKITKPFFIQNGLTIFQIPGSMWFTTIPGQSKIERKRYGYFLHITDMHVKYNVFYYLFLLLTIQNR
jgi:hypothetical protein